MPGKDHTEKNQTRILIPVMEIRNHIVILCSRLDLPGGIEKAVTGLANQLSDQHYLVTLLVLDKTDQCFFPLKDEIIVHSLPLGFGITQKGNTLTRKWSLLRDIYSLRKKLKTLQPAMVIATEYPFSIAGVLSGVQKTARLCSWEHHHFYGLEKNYFWEKMFRRCYPKLDGIVCLNDDEMKLYARYNNKVTVIPHTLPPAGKRSAGNKNRILTVSRLSHAKGTDLLLDAARYVISQHPGWTWTIIGDGEMKEWAQASIRQQGLEKQVIIQPPVSPDLSDEYAQAAIYACTSRYESFGLAISEALSAGVPVVSFDCETGPRHIITHEKNGLLAEKENPAALAAAVSRLITDENLRLMMGQQAWESARERPGDSMARSWDHFIREQLT